MLPVDSRFLVAALAVVGVPLFGPLNDDVASPLAVDAICASASNGLGFIVVGFPAGDPGEKRREDAEGWGNMARAVAAVVMVANISG